MARKKKPKEIEFSIHWTEEAIDSLWSTWEWLAERNEKAAEALDSLVEKKVLRLLEYPYSGPIVPELLDLEEYRQILLSKNHRLLYRVDDETGYIWILLIQPTRLPLSRFLGEP